MPNWCSNTIEIKGDKESIDEFKKFLDEGNGKDWFNFFLPTPAELKDEGWYEWNVNNWGCKWNCDAQDWKLNEDCYEYSGVESLDEIPEEILEQWNLRESLMDREEMDDEDE
jgi:hypothetical protein